MAFRDDVSREAAVKKMSEQIDQQVGTLTALVNNAGMLETQMRVEAMDAACLQRVLTTNVISYFLCTKEAIKKQFNYK